MIQAAARLPTVWRNVRSTRNWRQRDMINWHRMVRSIRQSCGGSSQMDFYAMLYDLCTTFAVDYLPQQVRSDRRPLVARAPRSLRPPALALFVDAPDHVSGVATTLRQWGDLAIDRGLDLSICYSGHEDLFRHGTRFPPIGTLRLGAYDGLNVHMPVVTDVLAAAAANPPAAVHVSTPGPMGLLGLMVARQFRVPVCGTYHTDFPSYATRLTGQDGIEEATWRYMRWFYGQLDRVAAPSRSTVANLVRQGLDPARLSVVSRGIRTDRFSPEFRDIELRARWGGTRLTWLLYVGRLSKEKNLACLASAFRKISERRSDVGLVVAGDGPYRETLEQSLAGHRVVFTGLQKGEALARIYASADLFVFPSETDTLGVVLLEAQASGLPVIVSGHGGPKDCILPGVTGRIVHPMTPDLLASAVHELLGNRRCASMGEAACAHAARHTPARSFDAFWAVNFPPAVRAGGHGRCAHES
jgi:glycosyltransferase involved in cell wall biosynthesis